MNARRAIASRVVASVALAVAIAFAFGCGFGCGRTKPSSSEESRDGSGDSSNPEAGGASGFELLGAPLIFAPTKDGFGLNAVLRSGDPSALRARVREVGEAAWTEFGAPTVPAADIAQWSPGGLRPGRRHEYEIRADRPADRLLYAGSAITARDPGAAFTFAILTDTHIAPRAPVPRDDDVGTDSDGFQEGTLLAVAHDVSVAAPDFFLNLGDTLDFHLFGFNTPPPDASWTRLGYLNYRRLLGEVSGHAALFPVIGNWDGENGCNTAEEIARSSSQRLLYVPGPGPDSYPQGGSANRDYYAFTWGDALFVVLNVMTYTPTCHLLDVHPGLPDDWTLGEAQLAWLRDTLAAATSRWRFLFVHHTVGGAAGDDANSAYGRGGGRAARVGEQAVIHDLMIRHGVQIFFYGHDHVFTDLLVDGVHYTLPGSAGAPWKFETFETGYTQYWPESGYGRVDVNPDQVKVTFIAAGGQPLTSFTIP